MKDRRRGPSISHDRWLVSYADFVTLLFAFFVVLYATAQVDKRKAVRLSDAIESAFTELGVFQSDDSERGFGRGSVAARHPGATKCAVVSTGGGSATTRVECHSQRNGACPGG